MSADLEQDFTTFVATRGGALFRTALGLTGHRQQAEDLVQTVLARAYLRWQYIKDGQPEAYLRRAMYLQCVSRWRLRSHGRELVSDTVPERSGPDELANTDLRLALQAALRRLGTKQRAVVVLSYLEDLTDTEIAAIMGCRPGTVRGQLSRALRRLRELCPELITIDSPSR